MEEVDLHPTIRRIDSTSTNSAIGSDYEIESICGLGGSEPYVCPGGARGGRALPRIGDL